MIEIICLDAMQAGELIVELGGLLGDCVTGGASIGFVLPLDPAVVDEYWRKVVADVHAGVRVLLVAHSQGRLVGTGQLALETRPNSVHRAEVQKVLVHPSARRQGVGRAIMAAVSYTHLDVYKRQGHALCRGAQDRRQGSAVRNDRTRAGGRTW